MDSNPNRCVSDVRITELEAKIITLSEDVRKLSISMSSYQATYGALLEQMLTEKKWWEQTLLEAKRKVVLAVTLGLASATMLGGALMLKVYLEKIVIPVAADKR